MRPSKTQAEVLRYLERDYVVMTTGGLDNSAFLYPDPGNVNTTVNFNTLHALHRRGWVQQHAERPGSRYTITDVGRRALEGE